MGGARREWSASVSVFELGGGVRTGGGFAAPVVGHTLIWAMRFRLCMRHLVHKELFIDEVLFIQSVPTCFGDRLLVHFFHDGERVSVLVVCGDAPPGPCTKHSLEVRFGRKRDKGVSFAFGRVSGFVKEVWREGDALDTGARSHVCVCVCFRGWQESDSAKRAMPPMVRYCGGMQSW